jgi:predicted nucleic acid-binding protein
MTYFVDTNVFVYRRHAEAGAKQARAAAVVDRLWREGDGRTSVQVLQEYYNVTTRKLLLPPKEIRLSVRRLFAWRPLAPSSETFERAWALEHRHDLSYWDALVVAAAQESNCTHILTEDLQDGQHFDELVVVNPFKLASAELPR